MKAAIMGYGTIGSGVAKVLDTNRDILAERIGEPLELKYILDLRDFPGDPHEVAVPSVSTVPRHGRSDPRPCADRSGRSRRRRRGGLLLHDEAGGKSGCSRRSGGSRFG